MALAMRVLALVLCSLFVSAEDRYHPDGIPRVGHRPVALPDPIEQTAQYWIDGAQNSIDKKLLRLQNQNTARNVIFSLGDGLSMPTITAARILHGQRNQRPGEESVLSYETFPTVGLTKTYCLNRQVADSACTATALFCGVKNNFATLGVTGELARHDCEGSTNTSLHLDSIAAWALADGRDVGLVTTTRVTHATPAGAFARAANRHWESDADIRNQGHDPDTCPDIAHQLIHNHPGNKFKVILGGGRREFLPATVVDEEGDPGKRLDGRDLIKEWQQDKETQGANHQYVWNRQQLLALRSSPPDYLLGLFESSHMQYHMQANEATEPTLAELTEIAIQILSRNEKGYFLFIEGGLIDTAHHDNYVELSLDETLEFAKAIDYATDVVSEEDTLVVVTADHSHVLAMNGYTGRGANILDTSDYLDDLGVPYMIMSYTNGPGYRPHVDGRRADVTSDDNYRQPEWRSHTEIPHPVDTHGGDDVAVFALGPHHHIFSGLYEQSELPHLMGYAACIGPGKHACRSAAHHSHISIAVLALVAIFHSII